MLVLDGQTIFPSARYFNIPVCRIPQVCLAALVLQSGHFFLQNVRLAYGALRRSLLYFMCQTVPIRA